MHAAFEDEAQIGASASDAQDGPQATQILQFYSKSKDMDDLGLGVCDWRKRLSNFWPCKIQIDGHAYPSVEHAFHAAKAACSDKPTMAANFRCGGRVGPSAQAAKSAGGKGAYKKMGASLDVAKWNAQRDDATMAALRARALCDPEFCMILRATAGKRLLHFERHAAKAYWGGAIDAKTGGVLGCNRLGEMLMTLRAELLRPVHE